MEIEKKFELGKKNRTYRRIDPEFNVDIFLGYNDDGKMSLVISEPGRETTVKSSKFIDVSMKRREDGKLVLSFDLLDDSYKSMFFIFCKDIIVTCEKAGASMAISSAVLRWKYWKNLFGYRKQSILDNSSIKGLLGELIQLRDFFIPRFGSDKAVASWMGPLLGHKDFEINDTWYEVKSVAENALQVNISSLEQLESESDGHLFVVRLEDTSSVSRNSINLNTVVVQIIDLIDDPDTFNMFSERLNNMGFEPDEEYDKYNYVYKGTEMYQVNEDFPRLRRRNVDEAIGNVKYTLLLNAISNHREKV